MVCEHYEWDEHDMLSVTCGGTCGDQQEDMASIRAKVEHERRKDMRRVKALGWLPGPVELREMRRCREVGA